VRAGAHITSQRAHSVERLSELHTYMQPLTRRRMPLEHLDALRLPTGLATANSFALTCECELGCVTCVRVKTRLCVIGA
jgi:hypothetical protein